MADSARRGARSDILIDGVADWLMAQALGRPDDHELLAGCCERLYAAGVPVRRASVGFRTLHPLLAAVTLRWTRDGGVETEEHARGPQREEFLRSPFHYVIRQRVPMLRRRLRGREALLDFPILEEFRDAGLTDYVAYLVPFGEAVEESVVDDGVIGSWATDRQGGFTDRHLHALERVQTRLAVVCRLMVKDQVAQNILQTYLGPDPGMKVLDGRITRGDGDTIHAVIWFSDLRDSTRLAESMPRGEFLECLNEFFECVAGPVLERGGQVLRFIGDAMLAIFPMEVHEVNDPRTCPVHRAACGTALGAAREAMSRMRALNARRGSTGRAPLGYGIGLHVGDVMYGNIGVPTRLEFSVIGAAANEAARIESRCKALGRPLLTSAEFASILEEPWQSVGRHDLRGVGGARELFSLPGEPAAA